jgi:hypothetical protein
MLKEGFACIRSQMDPNALLVDLNDLLRRDPTLSSLGGSLSPPAASNDVIGSMNSLNSAVTSLSMAIPKRNVTLLQPNASYKGRDYSAAGSSLSAGTGLIAPPPSVASSFTMWGEPLIKQVEILCTTAAFTTTALALLHLGWSTEI